MGLYVKDPDEVKPYTEDWATLLGADTIVTSTWIVPAGITEDSDTNTATTATITLSGGTVDTDYYLTNRITTAAGNTHDRYLTILVRDPAT